MIGITSTKTCIDEGRRILEPPMPPPQPPPLPRDKLNGFYYNQDSSESLPIDLVGLEGIAKPHGRMRTLNWRRIPKKRVLSHYINSKQPHQESSQRRSSGLFVVPDDKIIATAAPASSESSRVENRRTTIASTASGELNDLDDDTSDTNSIGSDEENTNIWLLIAKSNKWIRKEKPKKYSNHRTSLGGGSINNVHQPVSGTGSKGAARIKEMLESVRRRMVAVTTSSNKSTSSSVITCDKSMLGQSTLSLLTNFELDLSNHPRQQQHVRTKNVIDAINFKDLEELFCLNNQPHGETDSDSPNFIRRLSMRTNASSDSVISSNSYSNHSNEDDESLIESENILDSKKSLNVNIFLKQLKSPDLLIDLINNEEYSKIGKEKLDNLLKLLPDKDETRQLVRFKQRNKQHKLPVAERFLLRLVSEVPNPRLRIKFMLLQEEYCTDTVAICSELDKIEKAAYEIRHSKKLRDILNLVLVTGNFLNSSSYAADAAGFGLDCLERLNEIRSNQAGIYLIHYVAGVANKLGLIDFQQSELEHVELASRVCIDSIKMDLCSMLNKICDLNRDTRIELNEQQTSSCAVVEQTITTAPAITTTTAPSPMAPGMPGKNTSRVSAETTATTTTTTPTATTTIADKTNELYLMHLFDTLESIRGKVERLRGRLTVDLELTRKRLATYLCEDPITFKLHDCFRNLLVFSQRLKVAHDENERRKQQQESSWNLSKKCSLKRSKTINAKLPPIGPFGRQSLTGIGAQKEPVPSSRDSSFLSENMRRISIGNADNYELLTSSPKKFHNQSRTQTNEANISDTDTKQSYDDLHEGLMRLLIDTNGRRNSSFGSRQFLQNTGNRRFSKLIR